MSSFEQDKQRDYATLLANQALYKQAVTSIMDGKLATLKDVLDQCLLELGPSHNAQDVILGFQSDNQTLLHLAASSGHPDILAHLLSQIDPAQHKESVNLQDVRGNSPLLNATIAESAESMQLLLNAGADVNTPNKYACVRVCIIYTHIPILMPMPISYTGMAPPPCTSHHKTAVFSAWQCC
ncbi:ankyrin repeat domain-containing protein, partial [archaeon]